MYRSPICSGAWRGGTGGCGLCWRKTVLRIPAWKIGVVAIILLVLSYTACVAWNHLAEVWWIPLAAVGLYGLWRALWNRAD